MTVKRLETDEPCYLMDESLGSAREMLDYFLDERFQPRWPTATFYTGRVGFIFRGQADSRWALLPKAYRPEFWKCALQGSVYPYPEDERQRRHYLGDHMFHEFWEVTRFLETADKLGLATPLDYRAVDIHREDWRRLWNADDDSYKRPFPDDRLLPAFALAQHHGLPTRLLDWTESPLVAAYFAAYGASSLARAESTRTSERIAVFALHADSSCDKDGVQVVKVPRHGNGFLRVQKGLFTLTPQANEYFYKSGTWPALNDVVDRGRLTRVSIPSTEADELLRLLFNFDVTTHHLMPTLDHAAQAVPYSLKLFPRERVVANKEVAE